MDILMMLCNTDLKYPIYGGQVLHPVEFYTKTLNYKRMNVYTTCPPEGYAKQYEYACDNFRETTLESDKDPTYDSLGITKCNYSEAFDWGTVVKYNECKGVLEDLTNSVGVPYTTVISTNYAHGVSAPLSRIAFERSATKTGAMARLILNLDFHEDYGSHDSGKGNNVGNGGWGCHHVMKDIDNDRCMHIYAAYGIGKDMYGSVMTNGGGNVPTLKRELTTYTLIKEIVGAILSERKRSIKVGGVDIYITVDRDVLKYGCTHFPQGVGGRGILKDIMRELFSAITKYEHINVVGFDICGLPAGIAKCDSVILKDPKCIHSTKATEDINKWCGFMTEYM